MWHVDEMNEGVGGLGLDRVNIDKRVEIVDTLAMWNDLDKLNKIVPTPQIPQAALFMVELGGVKAVPLEARCDDFIDEPAEERADTCKVHAGVKHLSFNVIANKDLYALLALHPIDVMVEHMSLMKWDENVIIEPHHVLRIRESLH